MGINEKKAGGENKPSKPSYFYVLHCKDGSLYGGYTTNLNRRLAEHNSGAGAKYTRPKCRRPLRMIYAEAHPTRSAATKAEAAFKKLVRRQKDSYLIREGVQKPFSKQTVCIVKEVTE
ncbi:putative endonuclease [Alkalibacterium sp. AK22]|uniref:GIY-YIG nuclease family protein n=1 Tax=Alkalibacterium sp. AK22 TaxID=1229520 RepID=UPI000445643D|nr:GIY-YIG nuclease family protein [Alkalibacterium sp. AK22]EXJ23705.1 putative endonuclease [Alkalibacterium sp. AK22]